MNIQEKIEKAIKMEQSEIKKEFMSYLREQEIADSTIVARLTDSFYLWRNAGKEGLWKVIKSDNFDRDAKLSLRGVLSEISKSDVGSLLNCSCSHLRKLRNFICSDVFLSKDVDKEDVIKKFLLDIDCLDELARWTDRFNLFDVLKITRTEIRHSNMLGWFLSPDENHGLNDKILKGFIQYIVEHFSNGKDVLPILMMDFHSFIIQREWKNIDLIAKSDKEKFVLCIENKIGTSEHDNQLDRYRKIIESEYPEYRRMFLYLSPDGDESSEPDCWYSMSYQNVLDIIEKTVDSVELPANAKFLINNYIEIIRRDIVEDPELAEICKKIYYKHQKALDLIFEYKPDKSSEIADIVKEWIVNKGDKITYDEKSSAKKTIRFRTPIMDRIIPFSEEPNASWGTRNHYFYEIKKRTGNAFYIQFVIDVNNSSDEQKKVYESINNIYPATNKDDRWKIHYSQRLFNIKEDSDEEIDEQKIIEGLDKGFKAVEAFQEKLLSKITGMFVDI